MVSAVGHEIDVTISDMAADLRAPTPSAAAEILVQEKDALDEQIREIRDHLASLLKNLLSFLNQRLALISKGLGDPKRDLGDAWLHLDECNLRLVRAMKSLVHEKKRQLLSENRAFLLKSPLDLCSSLQQRMAFQQRTLGLLTTRRLKEYQTAFSLLAEKVKALSPLAVLKRGYSITRKLPAKSILRDVSKVEERDCVNVLLAEGALECRVEKVMKKQTV